MPNVSPDKRRLLREAIQHNIDVANNRGTPAAVRHLRATRTRFWVAFVLAAFAYAFMPSRLPSTNAVPSPRNAVIRDATMVASATTPTRAGEVPTSLPRPLDHAVVPLSVRRVVIDPGHGGQQAGAQSRSGMVEKNITLDIAFRLRKLMEQASFEVMMTRERDEQVGLAERVAFANARHADLFVSIHINWLPTPGVRPLETFYVGPSDDAHTLRLARLENHDAGYSLSDYRRLLEQVYMDARRDESRRFASMLNSELFRALSPLNPALENRGAKMAPFAVLIGTEMPAILVEVSCVSNAAEATLLASPEYRDEIARGLLKGIRSYATTLDGSNRRGL